MTSNGEVVIRANEAVNDMIYRHLNYNSNGSAMSNFTDIFKPRDLYSSEYYV
jgi:chromosome condensin MukBEF complex kleisin-like MukF subunit